MGRSGFASTAFKNRHKSDSDKFWRVLRPDGSIVWNYAVYRVRPESEGWQQWVGQRCRCTVGASNVNVCSITPPGHGIVMSFHAHFVDFE